jgi:P4 family phage/plasmid primase-like protien
MNLRKKMDQRLRRWPENKPPNRSLLFGAEIITKLEFEQDPPMPDWVTGKSWREVLAISGQTPQQYWNATCELGRIQRRAKRLAPPGLLEKAYANPGKLFVYAMQIGREGAKDYNRLLAADPNKEPVYPWEARVGAVGDPDIEDLAAYRGYGLDGARAIVSAGLIGKENNAWAFPVYDGAGTFRGVHELVSRENKAWLYAPKGIGAWPMIHGSLKDATLAFVLESSWDWLTFLLVTGALADPAYPVICTRGAETFAKIKTIWPSDIDAIAIPQNDAPGQKWLQNIADLGVKNLRVVQVPEPIHDLNDWLKAGLTAKDLASAIEHAIPFTNNKTAEPDKDESPKPKEKAEIFNEYEHVQRLLASAPPIRCVGDKWYVYEQGTWNPATRQRFRPMAQEIMTESVRTARRESGILSHVEGWTQLDESKLCGVYRFDRGDILINAANGVIRLNKDGYKLEAHSAEHGFTQRLAVSFEPGALCPLFRKTLAAALPNPIDRRLLKLCAGNLLIPDCRFEVCLCCYGAGGNMKSTIAEAIIAIFGMTSKAVTDLDLSQLCDPKGYSLPLLRLAAVNLGTELDAIEIEQSGNFKKIVSGEPIDAREIYDRPFTMTTSAKLWFLANNLPRFKYGTDAELRRIRFLAFDQKPEKEDKTLKARVKEEASGILLWLLEGARRLLRVGLIRYGSAKSRSIAKTFSVQNDPVRAFVEKRCVLDPEKKVRKELLGNEFAEFCNGYGLPGDKLKTAFFQRLYPAYPMLKRQRSRIADERFYEIAGIDVKEEISDDEDA